MKKLQFVFTALFIISLINLVNAQAPNWAWAKSYGGTTGDLSYSITTDLSGNVIITGSFRSPTISLGTTTLFNADSTGNTNDIFIMKTDASGNVLWANSAGGNNWDQGNSVVTDVSGNVFVTGYFESPVITFGTTSLANSGMTTSDVFIVKYDSSGNFLWAQSAGGIYFEAGCSIATDISGNLYITGFFESPAITFGTTTLTKAGISNTRDIFIVKYDAGGNVLWAKGEGTISSEGSYSIATDLNNNVFVTGYFSGNTITFGTTTLTNINAGFEDVFIVKYDAGGNVLWAKREGGTSEDEGYCIVTDGIGNVFIAGYFYSPNITFGTTTLFNAGYADIFIVKYDAAGNVIWARGAGGNDDDLGYSISTDPSGNVFMTGLFLSPSINFGTSNLVNTSASYADAFIVKYDASGNAPWAIRVGSAHWEQGNGVATDVNGNVFISGFFSSDSINFGTTILTNAGSWNIFIAKLDGTTGIENAENTNGFSIYPNPTNDKLTISNEQLTIGNSLTISITDITGKLIYANTATTTKTEISTKDFAKGIYLVKLQSKDFVETRKVIKN